MIKWIIHASASKVNVVRRILMVDGLENLERRPGSRTLAIEDQAIEPPSENFVKRVSCRHKIARTHGGGRGVFFAADGDNGNLNMCGVFIQQSCEQFGLKAKSESIGVPAHNLITAEERVAVVIVKPISAEEVDKEWIKL